MKSNPELAYAAALVREYASDGIILPHLICYHRQNVFNQMVHEQIDTLKRFPTTWPALSSRLFCRSVVPRTNTGQEIHEECAEDHACTY